MPLLEVSDLHTGYGAVPVLHGVDMSIEEGETTVLLGLNGAGKTTTLMTIAGLLQSTSGEIKFAGKPVTRQDARTLVGLGVVLVPEGRRVFPALSVQNNLRLGAWSHRRDQKLFNKNLQRGFELFPVLRERRGQMAGTLSGGEQQMLAIARGLMANPKLLLIDEASLGLSPKLAGEVFAAAKMINGEGVTVLMVEQNAGVLEIADRAYIMNKGHIEFSGKGDEILKQGELRKSYLGAPA